MKGFLRGVKDYVNGVEPQTQQPVKVPPQPKPVRKELPLIAGPRTVKKLDVVAEFRDAKNTEQLVDALGVGIDNVKATVKTCMKEMDSNDKRTVSEVKRLTTELSNLCEDFKTISRELYDYKKGATEIIDVETSLKHTQIQSKMYDLSIYLRDAQKIYERRESGINQRKEAFQKHIQVRAVKSPAEEVAEDYMRFVDEKDVEYFTAMRTVRDFLSKTLELIDLQREIIGRHFKHPREFEEDLSPQSQFSPKRSCTRVMDGFPEV